MRNLIYYVTYFVMFPIDHMTPSLYAGFPLQLIASVIPLNLREEIVLFNEIY